MSKILFFKIFLRKIREILLKRLIASAMAIKN